MLGKMFGKKNSNDVKCEKTTKNDGLSDTDRKLRDQFYTDPETDDSEIGSMLSPAIYAPKLYKQLAVYGHEKGWIADSEKYPLMYALLYNASDVVRGVYWRFQQHMKNDDNDHTGAFKMALGWCVYAN
ncbi:MAG: hypothetical protein J5841_06210 [Clostridia bacterium]|nr:hypothetical protein [Clostridia bacterium]